MGRSVAWRIALAVGLILILSTTAQFVVARFVTRHVVETLGHRLTAVGLQMIRSPARGGELTRKRLTEDFADFDELAVVTYDEAGRLVDANREIVSAPAILPEDIRSRARALVGAPVFFESTGFTMQIAGIAYVDGAGPVRYVGVFDDFVPRFLREARSDVLLVTFALLVLLGLATTALIASRTGAGIAHAKDVLQRISAGDLAARFSEPGDDELGDLARSFNDMASTMQGLVGDLQAQGDRRRRMFADWTHEIATPLTSVLGYLESLRMEDIDGDQKTRRRYVEVAHEQARALEALVEDLTTLSKLEEVSFLQQRRLVDLTPVVQDQVDALTPIAKNTGVILRAECQDAKPVRAECDPARIGQVLRNVLNNAIRHTPEGKRVIARLTQDQNQVIIEIEDEGTGIDPEHLAHLTERFYRPDSSRLRHTGGRGLGLAIADRIVETHGGSLNIRSTPGQGTTVRVSLPRPGA